MTALAVFIRNRDVDLWVPDMDGSANVDRTRSRSPIRPRDNAPSGRLTSKRAIDVVYALIRNCVADLCSSFAPWLRLVPLQNGTVYRHKRVGFSGKHPDRLKLGNALAVDAPERLRRRLATDSAAAAEWSADWKLRNDPRVTAIESILRRSSLDSSAAIKLHKRAT